MHKLNALKPLPIRRAMIYYEGMIDGNDFQVEVTLVRLLLCSTKLENVHLLNILIVPFIKHFL